MGLSDDFEKFCNNILLNNKDSMETSAEEIAKKLNNVYYNISNEANEHLYIVGSVGRNTAIKGASDLDLLFDLPNDTYKKFDAYESNGQSALLQEVKNYLVERYPKTKLRGDGQVVVIEFTNYTVELVPAFKDKDNKFEYPDTNDGGSWKNTDPISEKEESIEFDNTTNGNFINICHLIRKWKNNKGFKFGGLLIDTLVYNFLKENEEYYKVDYSSYFEIIKNLFKYLKNLNEEQAYWYALGSNQKIYNKDNGEFIKKAKKAYNSIKDINTESADLNDKLKSLFGNDFPDSTSNQRARNLIYDNTEELIEYQFPIDIRYLIEIDCKVTQDGWRPQFLSFIIKNNSTLRKNKELDFYISKIEVPLPYDIYWKIRNIGSIAESKNCIRGQINKTNNDHQKESTSFAGPHFVECYIVKNNICVARSRIDVPISNFL